MPRPPKTVGIVHDNHTIGPRCFEVNIKSSIPTKNRNKDSLAVENVTRGAEIFLFTALCPLL